MQSFVSIFLIVLLALLVYLYFLVGRWIVILYALAGAVVVAKVCRNYYLRRWRRRESARLAEGSELTQQIGANNIERRKGQSYTMRKFVALTNSQEINIRRFVNRIANWHLEYLHRNGIYHIDLYDYLIDRAKERLKNAEAHYHKQELRLTIELVRTLMRTGDEHEALNMLKDRLDGISRNAE